jgi:prepilin-type N-terminal cleavage/methylation domain-containing protein
MTRRSGFTLIEVLVVVSLMAVILPMAAGTIFFLLRAQSQSADGLRDAMGLTQFSHTFRTDVHASRSVHAGGSQTAPDGLVLELGDSRTIEYRAEPSGLVRRTERHGEVVERREQFHVGAAPARFQVVDNGREAAVTIVPRLSRAVAVPGHSSQPAGIRIAATVGRDRSRVASPTKGEGKK